MSKLCESVKLGRHGVGNRCGPADGAAGAAEEGSGSARPSAARQLVVWWSGRARCGPASGGVARESQLWSGS